MESKLAILICRSLLRQKAIENEYFDVYVYGLELILSFLFSTVIILLTGILLNAFDIAIIFLIIFIALRRFTGGYHAPTYLQCKLTTISIYVAVNLLCIYLIVPLFAYIPLLILGLYIILRYGPIENIYKPLTPDIKKRNKHIAFAVRSIYLSMGSKAQQCHFLYAWLCCSVNDNTNVNERRTHA